MRLHLITILISASTVLVSTAKPASEQMSSLLREKAHHIARQRTKPNHLFWRKFHKGAVKRSFDSLDLDKLLNDPVFLELEKEQLMKEMDKEQPAEDFLDFNALEDFLHDDVGASNIDFGKEISNEVHNDHKDFTNDLNEFSNAIPNGLSDVYHELNEPAKDKDRMSNVVPGAKGPFDLPYSMNHHPKLYMDPYMPYSVPSPAQANADKMMDEFMQFLYLKETGRLDQCLGFRKKHK